MIKEFINCNCPKSNCSHFNDCCKTPTEVIRHNTDDIKLFIFGMGPGRDEVRLGMPFVGRAGKYMREIIKHLWNNQDVGSFNLAISNNVRFHPIDSEGKDREPTWSEIQECIPYLYNDIKSLLPKCIIAAGKCAISSLFPNDNITSITRTRGLVREITVDGKIYPVIPTYHPSYLCRTFGNFRPEENNQLDREFISDILKGLEA